MHTIFKISFLTLTGLGAILIQNTPAAIHSSICSWTYLDFCPAWLDSAIVDQAAFLSLVFIAGTFFVSLIYPLLAKNYHQTVTAIARFDSSPFEAPELESYPTYWELTQVLSWIAFGEPKTATQWARTIHAEGMPTRPKVEIDQFNAAERELFEAFRAKKLVAKGKKNSSEIYDDIPADYFLSDVACQILHNVIDANQESYSTQRHWDGPKWRDVKIERRPVIELWPQKPTPKNESSALEPRTKLPDYKAWDLVPRLALFQAACLWAEKPVALPVNSEPEYAYLRMLKAAIQDRILVPYGDLKVRADWTAGRLNPNVNTEVTREALRAFAESKGERPLFLFPEDRGGKK
jgi:hypothetical protein